MESNFLKSRSVLREGAAVAEPYQFIDNEERNFQVRLMCRWLGGSRSDDYNWRNHPPSATKLWRRDLTEVIKRVFNDSDKTYGYRRVTAEHGRPGHPEAPQTDRKSTRL